MKFFNKSTLKLIGVNGLVLLVLLLLIEGGLHILFSTTDNRALLKFASFQQLRNAGEVPKYKPHRYLGYTLTPNYKEGKNRHNAKGFRGAAIQSLPSDSTYRIVCIGGSTTYTTHVKNYKESYPYLLQQYLKNRGFTSVEVINAGVGGWNSWESFVNFQFRILPLQPDMVVIYHGLNDVHARLVWPPAEYQPDNSGYRKANYSLDRSWITFLAHKSNILRIILVGTGKMAAITSWSTISKDASTSYLWKFKKQYESGTYPQGIFKKVSAQKMINSNSPVYFHNNIESLVKLAKSNAVKPVLATFATSSVFENTLVNSPPYKEALLEHNKELKKLAKQEKTPILDFAQKFPEDSTLYTDGRHMTKKGSRKKAEIFARFLTPILKREKVK